uniref:PEHE domain-containing protein n=1 Tax=Trichuris muris TaxID=70415 RepID=A0A5S6Q4H7_TRIMR
MARSKGESSADAISVCACTNIAAQEDEEKISPEEYGFFQEDLNDLLEAGININTLCSTLPATLSLLLDEERLGSNNLKRVEELRKYMDLNNTLSIRPYMASIESQNEEAPEEAQTVDDSEPMCSENFMKPAIDIKNGQSFLEELKEETRLRHEFLWSRAEAVKCRQSLHLLGEFMRPFWFPHVSSERSKYLVNDTDLKCTVLEPLLKPLCDKVYTMEGPLEFTRPWGNLSSVLHPEWQRSEIHDCHDVTKNIIAADTRTNSSPGGQNIEETILTQWLNTPFSRISAVLENKELLSEYSEESVPFEIYEDQLGSEKAFTNEGEVEDVNLKESEIQPRRAKRVFIHSPALAEKYAKKRLACKLKRRQIKARSNRRNPLVGSRTRLSTAESRKAAIERTEQRRKRAYTRQRNEDCRPLENFVVDDPVFRWEKYGQDIDIKSIEVPSTEKEPTPPIDNENESDEDTSDEAYYERHLPMEAEEKVVNAERRRLLRAWMKRRQALLRRQAILNFPNGTDSPTTAASPGNTSVTVGANDSPMQQCREWVVDCEAEELLAVVITSKFGFDGSVQRKRLMVHRRGRTATVRKQSPSRSVSVALTGYDFTFVKVQPVSPMQLGGSCALPDEITSLVVLVLSFLNIVLKFEAGLKIITEPTGLAKFFICYNIEKW